MAGRTPRRSSRLASPKSSASPDGSAGRILRLVKNDGTVTKKRVLSEEEYVAGMSAILRRDFFPDLDKLEALDRNVRPITSGQFGSEEAKSKYGDSGLTLADFQTQFTSEDNASFERLLERFNQEQRGKCIKVFGEERMKIADGSSKRLLLLPTESDQRKVDRVRASGRRLEPKNTRLEMEDLLKAGPTSDLSTLHSEYNRMVREHAGNISPSQSKAALKPGSEYGFVATTPLIRPGIEASPIFTWGQVEGTPLRIDNDARSSERKFRLPPTPGRESLGHLLAARSRAAGAAQHAAKPKNVLASPAAMGLLRESLGNPKETASAYGQARHWDTVFATPKNAQGGKLTPRRTA